MVGVEAQFSKLPCFFSDKVPVEVAFSETTSFIKLEESPTVWAKTILESLMQINDRKDIQLTDSINESYILLEDMYKKLYSRL